MPDDHLMVQGIVAARPGDDPPVEALVQYRQRFADGREERWQQTVDEAREHARLVVEAAANAAYEAAFVEWLLTEQKAPEEVAFRSLGAFRTWRRDKWGQPPPEDWRDA